MHCSPKMSSAYTRETKTLQPRLKNILLIEDYCLDSLSIYIFSNIAFRKRLVARQPAARFLMHCSPKIMSIPFVRAFANKSWLQGLIFYPGTLEFRTKTSETRNSTQFLFWKNIGERSSSSQSYYCTLIDRPY